MVARFSTLENQLNYQVVAINLASTTGYSFLLRTRKGEKKRRSFPSPFSPKSPTRSLKKNSRDLTKPRRRRQRERQKTIGLMSKTTNLHVHHAFLYISLPCLHNHGVKWPIFEFTWVRERQDDRFYHLCLNSCAVPSVRLQNKFPSFK